MNAQRHHDATVYVRPSGVPVVQDTYTLTGARIVGVRAGFGDYSTWGSGVAGLSGGSLDAPDQLPSGATRGATLPHSSRGFGMHRMALHVGPTFCSRER